MTIIGGLLPRRQHRVLVVDDKANFLGLFRRIFADSKDLELVTASDADEALACLASEAIDVVVSDVKMPGASGIDLLRQIKTLYPDVEVILMTAFGGIPDAVTAMKSGAFDYLTKPFDPDDALDVIYEAIERRTQTEKARLATNRLSASEETEQLETKTPRVAEEKIANDASSASPSVSEDEDLTKLQYREVLTQSRDRSSKEYLVALLNAVHGNVTQAAERAGLERESLHRLLKKYGLRADDFRGK